jgi:hypothetical protein
MTAWQVYWITRLDALHTFLTVGVALVGIISFVLTLVGTLITYVEGEKFPLWKWCRLAWIVFAIVVPALVLTPTTREAAVVYVLPRLTMNERAQRLPDKLIRFADEYLDAQIEKLVEEKGD